MFYTSDHTTEWVKLTTHIPGGDTHNLNGSIVSFGRVDELAGGEAPDNFLRQ